MGLWDTFSKTFGFTTSEDEEQETGADENEVDEEEDEEDEGEGFSFSRFFGSIFGRGESADDDEEDEAEKKDAQPEKEQTQPKQKAARSNVIHDPRMSSQSSEPEYTHCERIVTVRSIEECRDIIKCLLRGESVLLNLENVDPKDCGRVVDLLSGAAFALQGRMLKVAHLSYLLAPESVEVIHDEPYPNAHARYR